MINIRNEISQCGREIFAVSSTLLKIMIPIILIVKALEEMGAIDYIGIFLSPIMSAVGLPPEMGIVLAATIVTNIYGGMLMFVGQTGIETLTVSQATVMGGMMLLAHGLILEGAIANKVGMKFYLHFALRFIGAFAYGWLIYVTYTAFNWGTETISITWRPDISSSQDIWEWLMAQIENLLLIIIVIAMLIFLLRILKLIGFEKLLSFILSPLFKLFGINRGVTSVMVVGIGLGLSYGGALLIKEMDSGHISKQDMFIALAFISLFHSAIEDTLAVMLLGGDFFGLFWIRILFSICIIFALTRLLKLLNPDFLKRYVFS